MRLALAPCFAAGFAVAVQAGETTSAYTKVDLARCKLVDKPDIEFHGGYLCQGHGGLKVYRASGDQRTHQSYGRDPANACAAGETFHGFNHVGETIEWRLDGGKAFAAIARWYLVTDDSGIASQSWIVVTAIRGDDACHAALVQGSLPGANERARAAADMDARGFDCETGTPRVVAEPERPAADLVSGFPCAASQ